MPLFELPTIGDVRIVTMDRLEQVEAFTFFLVTTANVTATRGLDQQFATSTDGTTFTAFAPLDEAAILALVVDSDLAFYFKYRFERTGTDATDVIEIQRIDIQWSRDPLATLGPGRFTNLTIINDVVLVAAEMMEQFLIQNNSDQDAFSVRYQKPNACAPDNRPVIYFHRLDTTLLSDFDYCTYQQEISFRVGVKGQCERDEEIIRLQTSQLQVLFNEFTGGTNVIDELNFKGELRFGITPGDIGIYRMSSSSAIEPPDPDCDCIAYEFLATMFVRYPKAEYIVSLTS